MPTQPSSTVRYAWLQAPLDLLERAARICNGISRAVLVSMGTVMSVVILVQVFLRYVVKASLPWSEELARYLMVWIGMLGASLAMHQGRHVGVTFIVDWSRGLAKKLLVGAALLLVLGFLGLMLVQGIILVGNIWQQRSPAMSLPMVIPYGAVPLGALFMIVQTLLLLCRLVAEPPTPHE
jgi:TRAP-type C4-dicarboxylate transport system permease small subunit